jgi:tetrahydromethanopterin S-methyltransferase subunit A
MPGPISLDVDSIVQMLRRIVAEQNGVPAAQEVGRVEGTGDGVTAPFKEDLSKAGNELQRIVKIVLEDLNATHEAIRRTVEDMVAKDADNADEARSILAVLDATVATAPSPAAPLPPAASNIPRAW